MHSVCGPHAGTTGTYDDDIASPSAISIHVFYGFLSSVPALIEQDPLVGIFQ
jgi:hypothetical protein